MNSKPRNLLSALLEKLTLDVGGLDIDLKDGEVQSDLNFGRMEDETSAIATHPDDDGGVQPEVSITL